jgi:hypothetical protein
MSFQEYCRLQARVLNNWFGKMTLQGMVAPLLLYIVFMGNFSGPEKINKTCWKMT